MSQKEDAGRGELEKLLEKGYAEMSEINLTLANESLEADNEALEALEKKLTECE